MLTHIFVKKILQDELFNLFPIRPALTYNGKRKTNTKLSIVCSCLFLCASVAIIFYLGMDIWMKEKPVGLAYTEISPLSPKMEITNYNFFLAFRIEDMNGNAIENISTIVSFKAQHTTIEKRDHNTTVVHDPLNLTKCSNIFVHEEILRFFIDPDHPSGTNLDTFYCVENLNLNITGYYGKGLTSLLEFSFKGCRNSTSNITCESLNKTLGSTTLSMYIMENIVNLKNYSNPFVKKISYLWDYLDPNKFQVGEVFLKQSTVITEDGLISNESDIKNELVLHKFQKSSYHKNFQDNPNYYSLQIFLSNEIEYHKRTYMTIPLLLAEAMSVISILLAFSKFVVELFNEKLFKIEILNCCLDFSSGDDENYMTLLPCTPRNTKASISRKITDPKVSTSYLLCNDTFLPQVSPLRFDLKASNATKAKQKLKYSFCQAVIALLCEKPCLCKAVRRNEKIFKITWKMVKKKFDIIELIELNTKFHFLASLILNEPQQKLFGLREKDCFDIEEHFKKKEKEKKMGECDSEKEYAELMEYYFVKKAKSELSPIDEKLVLKLKDEVKMEFESF